MGSGILWHTLAYSSLLWHTLAYSGILWLTLAYSGIIWHTLAYSGILWHTLAIPYICHFFTRAKFLENKIYTKKRQFFTLNLEKMPIFRVKSVKNSTGQKKFTRTSSVRP